MINNIIGVGATLLGLAMAKKGSITFLESNTYSEFEVTDFVLDHIVASEGFRESAYYATEQERKNGQVTIGYGSSYLFLGDGKAFNNKGSSGVKAGDTLSSLKVKMGYPSFSSQQFALQLIKNHIKSVGGAYLKIAKDLDSRGISYTREVAEFLAEFSYGSQSAFNNTTTDRYRSFINVLSSNSSKSDLARACSYFRLGYYSPQSAWNTMAIRYSWSRRVYGMAMHIKGVDINDTDIQRLVTTKNATGSRGNYRVELQNLASLFRTELGVIVAL